MARSYFAFEKSNVFLAPKATAPAMSNPMPGMGEKGWLFPAPGGGGCACSNSVEKITNTNNSKILARRFMQLSFNQLSCTKVPCDIWF